MDSRDVANDCPGATEVDTNTLDLILDQGADIGRKRFVEKIVSLGKKGDLNARRRLYSIVPEKTWGAKVFDVLAERYKERSGGYTRIMKAGFRYGDSAPMAVIELVDRDPEALGQDSGPVLEKEFDEVEN